MVNFLDLSNEVYVIIASYLADDRKSLFALYKTHHRFKTATLISLYKKVSLDAANPERFTRYIRALAINPFRASYVQAMKIDGSWGGRITNCMIPQLTARTLYGSAMKRCGLSEESNIQWLKEITDGSKDAWIALLLLLVPNLTSLKIVLIPQSPYVWDFVFNRLGTDYILPSSFPGGTAYPLFRRLTSLVIEPNGPIRLAQILPFFRLPSLRKFTLNNAWGKRLPDDPTWPAPGSSRMETINLTSYSGMDGLLDVISLCSNLKSLTYRHKNMKVPAIMHGPASRNDAENFRRFIKAAKNSLENLWYDYSDPWFIYPGAVPLLVGNFSQLTSLQVRDGNLFDGMGVELDEDYIRQLLPRSLVELQILQADLDGRYVRSQLVILVTFKKSALPNLSSIRIKIHPAEVPFDILYPLCMDLGITFDVRRVSNVIRW